MANTYSWGYTNTTESTTVDVAPVQIGSKSNYAKVSDSSTEIRYDNTSAPLDQGEKISYFYRDIPRVDTDNDILNPAATTKGAQFIVKLDAVRRTTTPDGDVYDAPQTMTLTVRGAKNGGFTAATVEEQFKRLIGAVYDFTSSEFRFEQLMRSSLEITED